MAAGKKRDIMDALLKGTTEDLPEDLQTLASLIHRKAGKKAASPAAKPRNPATGRNTAGTSVKKKTTYYLSREMFDVLDETKEKINTLMQKRKKARVSKSGIVNQALKMILKDFAKKGEKSPLVQEILKSAGKG